MTTYNTGNPLGSTDPRDLYDNAENLDAAVNSTDTTWTDRFGRSRVTLAGQAGYHILGSYAPGIELTMYNQVIEYNGEFYRAAAGTLPYTTTATTPDVDSNLVSVGDAVLRQELGASTAGQGSDLIAHTGTSDTVTEALDRRTVYVASRAEMKSLTVPVGTHVYLTDGGRAGDFVIKSGTPPSDPHEGIYVVLANGGYAERVYSGMVSVKWFGAIGDGLADDILPIQAALDLTNMAYLPSGRYKTTASIIVYNGSTIHGDGKNASTIEPEGDFEAIKSQLSDPATESISDVMLYSFGISRTLQDPVVSYHISLENPSTCVIKDIYIKQNESVGMDAANRVGGIHLKSAGGNPYPGSVNRIYNVHIQGGSLWIESRDNHIENCYVWAWTVDKGVFLGGASNYMSLVEVIPSPVAHGFYFNSSAVNCSMVNCIVDGSTDTILGGTGIYGDRSHRTRIIGCTIYNCSKRAISFRDALDCMVIGCNFYNNNRISDPSQAIYDGTQGYDDVVIESSLFPASGNIITNNTFRLTNDRTIKGYAIRESNAGSSPGANIISNNHFTASNYLTPYIKRESSETSLLNNKGPSLVSTVKYGTATITVASGLSYVIVNHGMPYTDIKESDIFVHATSNLGGASYFTHDITSSNNFAIRLDSLPAQDVSFSWAIRIA